MILILIALISVTAISVYGHDRRWTFLSDFICPVFAAFGFIGLIIYSFVCYEYLAAEHKANIINREYNTNYSQIEVFYASDVIDTVRQLDRKRIELNGDLITGK